jgi:membrane associated rhomboid family serine protease
VSWLIVILVLGGITLVMMTADERIAVARGALERCRDAVGAGAGRWAARRASGDPLPLATTAVAVIMVAVFVGMLTADGALRDPATVLAWGGSVGPRTTNGEWWRLVTATFVHSGPLQLAAMLAGFVQVGCLVERAVGRLAFLSVVLVAGTVANLLSLYTSSIAVTAGASGAVFGACGLLAATCCACAITRSSMPFTWRDLRRSLPGVAVFVVYVAATSRLSGPPVLAALAIGLIAGLMLARGDRSHATTRRRVTALAAAATATIVVCAVPLRGIADVRPAVDRVAAVEARTSKAYLAAATRFRDGTLPATALIEMIDQSIVPDLRTARAQLAALEGVPDEQQRIITGLEEYFRLRNESWELRSAALRSSRMRQLQEADAKEWQALAALKQTRAAE